MVNRCVKDRQRSPSERHLIFLVALTLLSSLSLTTHLWVLTRDPNRHIWNTWVTRRKVICLGWAKLRWTRRLVVPGQSDINPDRIQPGWCTRKVNQQKQSLSDLRWYPACGTDKLFCPLNNIPINHTFGFSDMVFSVTGSIQLNKLLCWNQHRLSLDTAQQVMLHRLYYLEDKQIIHGRPLLCRGHAQEALRDAAN